MNGTADWSSPPSQYHDPSSPPARPRPRRISGAVQTLLLIAFFIGGVVALNWPITFATESPGSTGPASAQTLLAQDDPASSSVSESVAEVAERANPAVVTITNFRNQINPLTGEEIAGEAVPFGVGSGYIVDELGHVVTNQHVTDRGSSFKVQFYDGTIVDATYVGADPFQDVAVLKLELDEGQTVPGTLSFGDSDAVRSGDQVIAIGSPYGEFINSVTSGSVAAVDRSLETEYGYPLVNLIQHSAPIYEGNSGGPLLNMAGEVIGMNVAKITQSGRGWRNDDQEGIGFAIASDSVQSIVNQIIEKGTIARAYLGIGSNLTTGATVVESLFTDGPAERAGMRIGDIITELDGEAVTSRNPLVTMLILEHAPGDTIDITVVRDGQELRLTVTLGERPANLA